MIGPVLGYVLAFAFVVGVVMIVSLVRLIVTVVVAGIETIVRLGTTLREDERLPARY